MPRAATGARGEVTNDGGRPHLNQRCRGGTRGAWQRGRALVTDLPMGLDVDFLSISFSRNAGASTPINSIHS
jgi:hypothetical protein